jgi:hypothetical protein
MLAGLYYGVGKATGFVPVFFQPLGELFLHPVGIRIDQNGSLFLIK